MSYYLPFNLSTFLESVSAHLGHSLGLVWFGVTCYYLRMDRTGKAKSSRTCAVFGIERVIQKPNLAFVLLMGSFYQLQLISIAGSTSRLSHRLEPGTRKISEAGRKDGPPSFPN